MMEQDEKEIRELVRLMFETELYRMDQNEKLQAPVEFSGKFQKKMERLIKNQRQKYEIRKAAKYTLSVIAMFLILLCLLNPRQIARAWDVLVTWHSTHLEIDMPGTEGAEYVPEYELTYVPEGFVVVMEEYDEFGGVMLYKKGEKYFRLTYSLPGGNHNYDNEYSEISLIQDEEGNEILFIKYEDGGYSMLWESKDGIMFSMYADVTEEELIKIKEGIKAKNKKF